MTIEHLTIENLTQAPADNQPRFGFFGPGTLVEFGATPEPASVTFTREQRLLVINESDTGRELLSFDITEAGVEVTYDPADLPRILEIRKGLI